MKHKICLTLAIIPILSCFLMNCTQKKGKDYRDWKIYRGDEGSNAYSQLNQINTGNIKQLKVAWIYRTGDKAEAFNLACNPIIINDILYGIYPRLKTFSLCA